jgi:GAF domain-containing protein
MRQLEMRLQQLTSSQPNAGLASRNSRPTTGRQAHLETATLPYEPDSYSTQDLHAVIEISRALLGTIELDGLMCKLIGNVLEATGADKCVLVLERDGALVVEASSFLQPPRQFPSDVLVQTKINQPLEAFGGIPHALIRTVWALRESIVLNEVDTQFNLMEDEYIDVNSPNWVVCTPLLLLNQLLGVLYLENNLKGKPFRKDRLWLIGMISAHMGISLNNTYLFERVVAKSGQLEVRTADDRFSH